MLSQATFLPSFFLWPFCLRDIRGWWRRCCQKKSGGGGRKKEDIFNWLNADISNLL